MLKICKTVQGIFAIIFGLTIVSVVIRGYLKYPPVGITLIIICGILFTAGVIWLYNFLKQKTLRMSRKQINKIFFCIAAAVLVFQLISAFVLKYEPTSDLGYVDRAAREFSQTWDKSDLYNNLPERHKDYFVRYTNNQALLVILSIVYSVCQKVIGTMPLIVPVLINTIGLNISFVLLYFIAGKIFRDKFTPLFSAIIGAGFSVFYSYTSFFYTDSMSMPFVMGAIYLFLSGIENKITKKKVLQLICSGLLIAIGYKLKGSVIILVPVFLLYLVITSNKTNLQTYLKAFCILLTGIIVSTSLCSTFINNFNIANENELEETQFPPHHWIMMGLHDRGGFYIDDFWFTINSGNYEDKKEANTAEIKNRISDLGVMGMVKHIAKKVSWTWGDGTYFIGYYFRSKVNTNVFKTFITSSTAFKFYCSMYQCMLLFMILISFISGAVSNREGKEIFLKIIICGLYFFFIIWETRSRYLVNFSPIFIITATYSIKTLATSIKTRFTEHKKFNIKTELKNAV